MTYPKPVSVGNLGAIRASDVVDKYIDIANDLVTGEAVSSVAFTVRDASGVTVAGVVTDHTDSGTRTDFRITAPATVGPYEIAAVFTIDDGQKITRYATFQVV